MDYTHTIFFRPFSRGGEERPDYELRARAIPGAYVPSFLSEDERGIIYDLVREVHWDSLSEMSRDLKVEILSWGSDVGN